MKIKKFSSTQKALLLTSASKLAISPSTASAGSKTGDGPPPNLTPQISLNQVVVPIDAFVPPMNDPNLRTGSVGADPSVNQFEGNMNAYGKAGIIFVGEIPDGGARMDFIVGNVRNDMPTDVYVVVSKVLAPDPEGDLFPGIEGWNTAPRSFHTGDREMLEQNLDGLILGFENAPPEEKEGLKFQAIKVERDLLRLGPSAEKSKLGWRPRPGRGNPAPLVLSGEICVDMENLEILGGVRVQPTEPLLVGSSSIGDARQLDFSNNLMDKKSTFKLRHFQLIHQILFQ